MVVLYKPELRDLWFRRQFLADESTMSYNHAWGGTVDFPEEAWADWYDHWLVRHENRRFYRYLMLPDTGVFVGEIAYHFDGSRKIWVADVIVAAPYRGNGYGREGLRLLCEAVASHGIGVLRDDIAVDNPAAEMFLAAGFREEYRTDEIIMLKKELRTEACRILVIGCPGSGKSTFARRLRDRTELPLYPLDRIYHRPDRTTVSREEFDARLAEILKEDSWIIDGNYRRTLPVRLERCTDVFLFDLPAEQCLKNVTARIGKLREDMPWTEQELDPEFRQIILDFRRDQLPEILGLLEQYRDTKRITVFRSQKEADRWPEI